MKESAISVKNLVKEFKIYESSRNSILDLLRKKKFKTIKAVNGISFDIYKEEFVGFIGQNGAGKTTTLKCLIGLLSPDSGEIDVLGYLPQRRKYSFLQRISLVMGNRSQLWWELPAVETFLLNKEIYQIEDGRYNEIVAEMVKALSLEEILDIPVRKLSLGERMKCELVASFLHTPEILFLDEPTLGLDIVSQQKLRDFLSYYQKRYKSTVLLTSHNMEDIKSLCKRVIVIEKGKILYDGKLTELTENFVKEKYLRFRLNEVRQEKNLKGLGRVVEFDGRSGLLLVDRSRAKEIIRKLIDEYDVEDIDIEEPSLESVVKNIFSGKY